MACTSRRMLLNFLWLAAAGCTSTTAPEAPPPVSAAPPLMTEPAAVSAADEDWLAAFRARTDAIAAGETPPPLAPPVAAAQPAPVAAPTETVAQTPPAEPAAAVAAPAESVPPVAEAPPAAQPAPTVAAPAAPRAPLSSLKQGDIAALLEASREYARLSDDRVATLVAAFVDRGLAALAAGDLVAAQKDFAHAYELDPDDPAARELYFRSSALAGLPVSELPMIASSAGDRMSAAADQTRQLLQQALDAGDRAMGADDPDAALASYEQALTLLRSHPGLATSRLGEADLAARVAVARRASLDAAQRRDEGLASAALRNQELAEQAASRQTSLRIRQLMAAADEAFLANDYDATEEALNEVLRLDPWNAEAESRRRISQRARHGASDRSTREAYRREWQDTFDDLTHLAIPQNDLILFPDAKDWSEITVRGDKRFGGSDAGGLGDLDEAVRLALETRIPVEFEDEPLSSILDHFHMVTGANFVPSPTVRDGYLEEPYSLSDRNPQPVSRILALLLEDLSLNPMTFVVRDGVVRILARDEAVQNYVLQMYDIRDLTFTPSDYPAQDFNLLPSGIDADSYRSGVEDDDPLPLIGADALQSLIQDNIAPNSWSDDPNRTIQLIKSTLVVRQTPDVHEQIRGLLSDLRRNTKTLIHIETRFIEVEDSFLEDIGVDLRGLDGTLAGGFPLEDFGQSGAGGFGTPNSPVGIGTGNDPGFFYGGGDGDVKGRVENLFDFNLGEPGTLDSSGGLSLQALFLDDTNVQAVLRAVTKYQTSNIVNAPSLTLRSGQRGNVKSITTRTYVRDFEPEIAQAAVIAQPELDNVKEGVVLDVRAVASADMRFITLELRPTIIDLVPGANGELLPQQTVSLATQSSADVTIELPELRIQRLRTTATIPDGATLMLGGLKTLVEQKQSSGVPFLSDIPILGSLFSRQGEYNSKRKLIILLKASILNPEEHEPRSLGLR